MNFPIKLPPDLVDKPYFDMGDIMRIIPYSPNGVRSLVRKGKLPAPFKLGGKDLFDAALTMDSICDAISRAEVKSAA